ncbi:MAG: MFS transporter [Chloroflexi bacterium]|nr:MFS transporter [Chloroflexota bacterium]
MLKIFQAFKNYNYRLFWLGQVISLTGTWMQSTAQAWLVLQLTKSPLAVGVVTALQTLPILLFTLFGGVFADRVPKRKFLIFTQIVSAGQALILASLTGSGLVQLWHLYGLALLLGMINAFDNPTRQAFVAEMVPREDLPNAVALNSSLFNAARIVGPAIGGLTIATLGIAGAFYANAISFVPAIATLWAMKPELFLAVPPPVRGNVFTQVGEGLSYVRHTTSAFVVVIVMAILGTFGYNFSVTLPLIAEFVLHTNAIGFGALTAFMGVGSLFGALILAYRSQATYPLLLGSSAVFAIFLLGVALSHLFAFTAVLLVLLGFASIAYTATSNTLLQLNTPDHLRGRVMSIFFLLFAGTTPIGGFITGTVATYIGVPETLMIEAGICAVGAVIGIRYYYRHRAEILVEPGIA